MSKADKPVPKPRVKRTNSTVSTSSTVGYTPVDFLPSELTCPICQEIIDRPLLFGCCGIHLCGSCVERIEQSPSGSLCPYCREPLKYLHNPSIQRQVNAIQVYCPNQSIGCRWIGNFSKVDEHIDSANLHLDNNCEYVTVQCSFEGCQAIVPRGLKQQHENMECNYRPVTCPHCRQYTSDYSTMQREHFGVCPRFPTNCPNECGIDPLPKEAVEGHLMNVCPLQEISCDYLPVGCHIKRKRVDMQRHISENVHYHNSILLKGFVSLRSAMEEKTKNLEDECTRLRQQNKILNSQVSLLTAESSSIYEELQATIDKKSEKNQGKIEEQDVALSSLSDKLTVLEQIQKDSTSVEGAMATIETRLNTLGSNLQEVEKQLPILEQEVDRKSLQESVMKIQENICYIEQWLSPTPPFAFTFGRFAAHRQSKTAFSSNPFYSRIRGYKMCIRVDPISAGGNYVGVYCCIMRGEHDDFLKWPFQGVVHIRLQNHLGDHNHFNQVIRYDESTHENRAGQVKTGDKNYLHGYPRYISHGELLAVARQNRQYLKGDALDFEVTRVEEFN